LNATQPDLTLKIMRQHYRNLSSRLIAGNNLTAFGRRLNVIFICLLVHRSKFSSIPGNSSQSSIHNDHLKN
jgi:hypothetical protein